MNKMSNVLLLNKELYRKAEVLNAAEAFSGIAVIRVGEEDIYWKCCFDKSKASIERTIHEFENYLIGLACKEG